ncbi:helix-turn-helix domain-containing protein [Bacillaceae bacterium C204]|uniref:helix-turn-helix domain-containing protein n=1 Tax=Neobacillus sp. 204 TaxID=3383351 RepID=UPI00397917E7
MNESERDLFMLMRRKKKISQNDLSKVLECSQTYVSFLETGTREVAQHYVDKYKKYILEK